MKPLSQRQKEWAEAHLVRGRLRAVARPAYRAVLAADIAFLRAAYSPTR